ncbi:MAG TPA: ferredoxin [Trebonia sp.]
MTAQISVDRSACKLHGECAAQAPEIFAFDDAGELTYRSEIDSSETGVAEDAVFLCPTQAITLAQGAAQ